MDLFVVVVFELFWPGRHGSADTTAVPHLWQSTLHNGSIYLRPPGIILTRRAVQPVAGGAVVRALQEEKDGHVWAPAQTAQPRGRVDVLIPHIACSWQACSRNLQVLRPVPKGTA